MVLDVAGAAALLLQADPSKTGTAAASALVGMATSGKIPNPKTGSPNKLLFIGGMMGSGPSPTPPAPSPSSANVVRLLSGRYILWYSEERGRKSDGICCSDDNGNGEYKLTDLSNNKYAFATGGEFGSLERKPFFVFNEKVVLNAPAPTPTPPAPAPTPSSVILQMKVVYDDYPEETEFRLQKQNNNGS
eukprot:scaffold134_cov94-Amphora_coffeaeformis.AAC.9